jgi:hypothetical protein
MNQVIRILSLPHPLEEDRRRQLLYNLVISIITVTILVIYEPFGLSSLNVQLAQKVLIFLAFGAVTFLFCLMSDFLIKPAFPGLFDEQRWTVGKNIVWIMFLTIFIAVGNLFLSNAFGYTGVSGTYLLSVMTNIATTIVWPSIIITLVLQYFLHQSNRKQIEEINMILIRPVNYKPEHPELTFKSDEGRPYLQLSADQFIFAESADNFTDVVYVENGITRRELISYPIHSVEQQNPIPYLLRIHHSYLVNLSKIKKAEANAQGARLFFHDVEQQVPVPRPMIPRLKQILLQIRREEKPSDGINH